MGQFLRLAGEKKGVVTDSLHDSYPHAPFMYQETPSNAPAMRLDILEALRFFQHWNTVIVTSARLFVLEAVFSLLQSRGALLLSHDLS